jgi:osmotically-inducible protein OsmY
MPAFVNPLDAFLGHRVGIPISAYAVILATAVLIACQGPPHSTSQQSNDDLITRSVTLALVEDRVMNLVRVDVDTEDGVVYLTNEVDTVEHKMRAEQIARTVYGVKDVVNKIKVHD